MFGLNLGQSNSGTRDTNTITTVEPIKKPPQHQIQQSIVSFNTQQALANLMALSRLTQNGAGISQLFETPGSQNSQQALQTPISSNSDNMLMSSNNLMTTTEHAQMQIRCKFGTLGEFQGQFQSPHGFTMGRDEEIVVADTYNHRIQVIIVLFWSICDEIFANLTNIAKLYGDKKSGKNSREITQAMNNTIQCQANFDELFYGLKHFLKYYAG